MRTKAAADSVVEILSGLQSTTEDAKLLGTDMAVQGLLAIGTKSLSHFLNLLERYISVWRFITSSAPQRQKALSSIATFCGSNLHFVQIAVDKLMRYQILDPIDVVRWTFSFTDKILTINQWDMLSYTLDLLNTRVSAMANRLELETADNAQGVCLSFS